MNFENDLAKVGCFGRYQKRLCAYLLMSGIPNGYLVLSIVFVGFTPPHRCNVPEFDSGMKEEIFNNSTNKSFIQELSRHLPLDESGEFSECSMFKFPVSLLSNETRLNSSEVVECQHGWIYDVDDGRRTFVSDWDLVCSQSWMKPLVTSLFMIGVLVGSATSGVISDKFGRRPVFLAGTYMMFIFFGLCGAAPSPNIYIFLMFMSGASNMVNYMTAFVLVSETIGTKNRVMVGTLVIGGFTLGYMMIPLIAYFITSWRTIYFITGCSGILFIPYYWLIPESPRWLYCRRRVKEYRATMRKIGQVNGLSEENLSDLFDDSDSNKDVCDIISSSNFSLLTSVFRNKKTTFRLFSVCFAWFSSAVVYYGISFNTSNLGGNPYLNCFLAAVVEIPAYMMTVFLLEKFGRKRFLLCTLILSALSCGSQPFLETSTAALVVIEMIGKFAITASFDVIYIFSVELFPTSIRNSVLGFGSSSARVGASVSPFIMHTGKAIKGLPHLIMGALGGVSALLILLLPETGRKPLPDFSEDL